ncbi:lytic polysaccharide monooxygenase [Solwaraspora sp. WMMA2080]|uniref:lytic polysaccharide monooxygenase auxiliary activity family 9 protein n=1 Tax=unclassified Solwaraspora TaxID=2627926 RepID=UPI00248BC7CA|nr:MULTISPECIES: lytic polysaccharide monooxygenase [unclassified Solwaraspora]WBB98818.1 lytic polysaccharide monooxygenase [Solwaraspora sp. WMMA2059]WBC22629.1 lytic polysaccharide monooxygenase [Solwaraspora sp. WMMA2080]
MPTLTTTGRRPLALYALVVAVAAGLLLTTALANVASAHGSVLDPASRNYGCLDRWGGNHMAPEMATEDPMCYQAWQANAAAMWNWNGLYREGVGGNHQGAIPDGQLCSGGRTEGGRYNAMDAIGNWRAKSISNSFSVRLFDQASHGADYIRVYVTRQGFNPISQALGWGNLELVAQIGNTPASQWQSVPSGVQIDIPATAPGRTGRHMVYTIWQASHMDQSYYFCSDVNFGGSNPPPTTAPPTTPPPTTAPPTTAPPTTPPPGSAGCTASYTVASSWSGGFQGEVRVTAGSSAISGWTVTLAYPSGQTVQQAWNATVSASGSTVTARNVAYNGSLGAGASTSFGFIGSSSGGTPSVTCSAS